MWWYPGRFFLKDMDVIMIILVFLSNLVVWALGYVKGYDDALDDTLEMIDEIIDRELEEHQKNEKGNIE